MAAGPHDVGAERRLAFVLASNLVLGLAGLMTFQALIPEFIRLWGLSNTAAGWLSGTGFAASAVVAPVAVTLTDRVDARGIVLAGGALSAVAGLGFAWLAEGFWSALPWRLLSGAGIALTYMPGLKALTDRTHGPRQGRLQSIYTASYSLGTALSLLAAGLVAARLGWRWAFVLSGLLPALGALLVARMVGAHAPWRASMPVALFDFRPVLKEPVLMRYILGYAGHCWELFGFRSWMVAFLAFAAVRSGAGVSEGSIALLATAMLLLGLPASIFGNELATRQGRPTILVALMLAAAASGAVLGFLADLPFWLLALLTGGYATLMMADSAALTVGTLAAADPARRGATIAVQQFCGTLAAVSAPLAAGLALDLFGNDRLLGWGTAMAVLGAGALAGALAVARYGRPAATSRRATSSQAK